MPALLPEPCTADLCGGRTGLLLTVAQHVVGLCDLPELLLGPRLFAFQRVVLQGQLAVAARQKRAESGPASRPSTASQGTFPSRKVWVGGGFPDPVPAPPQG